MDSDMPVEKPRRGRRRKADLIPKVDASDLKTIALDEDLKSLIDRKNTKPELTAIRVKLPEAVLKEMGINIESVKKAGNTSINQDDYVKYALDLANENLSEILRRHLQR
jgi:hypothetical protein